MTPYDMANEFARPELADLLFSYGQVFAAELGHNVNPAEAAALPVNRNSSEDLIKSFYAK